MSPRIGEHAVVIGAGMGGLPAARALADHFERVTVVERDELPGEAAQRAGIPQGRHAHALLGGGQRALGELFPGLEEDLARAGAVPYRVALDNRVERPGFDPFPQRDFGWVAYTMSRPLIELVVRRRLAELPNVTVRSRCRAEHLIASEDGAVAGVQIESLDGPAETLPADLVVDASGRGSLTLALLDSLGHPRPAESTIGVDFGYASALFAVPDDAPEDWKVCMEVAQAPGSTRIALLLPLEGRRWIVSLGGRHDDKAPGDWDGFLAFARGLRTPTIYQAIRHAGRLGDVARFGFPASVWRRFDGRLPRGLLPIADTICRFNPIYGQGMSVAAQEACLLRRLLAARAGERDPLGGLAQDFFTEAQAIIDGPWTMAAIPDLVYPQTVGERPADFAATLASGAAMARLAAEDPEVHRLMTEVQHLLKPRSAFRDPDLQRRIRALIEAG
jgi:2-polyprenyl-6-methoxyphenol hydroxylase-like FAD-dependent oxidoreductase